jgi:ABC-type Fe3+ transport system permease subunit
VNWLLLKNSLLVAGLTTVLAVGSGFLASLWLAGLPTRWRNAFLALAVMTLALPPFLVTNCWLHFLGATGVWRGWLPFNIVSLGGTIWILSLLMWPIALFAVSSAWTQLQPSQLEGDPAVTGWWLIRGLLWPLSRTALAQAAVLTFVLALNNFAVPAILQVKVFPAEIWVRFNTTFDTLGALRLSWPLIVAPLLLLLWLRRQELPWPRVEGPVAAKLFRQQLGVTWFRLSGAFTIVLCLLAIGLPLFQILSVKRTWTELPGALAAGQLALRNSFSLAGAAATAVVGVALTAAQMLQGGARRSASQRRRKLDGARTFLSAAAPVHIKATEPSSAPFADQVAADRNVRAPFRLRLYRAVSIRGFFLHKSGSVHRRVLRQRIGSRMARGPMPHGGEFGLA